MIAWELFKSSPLGFFIDVGAFDGVDMSNTYLFEQQGWRGICFEPNPATFDRLKENRRCILINCAVGEKISDGVPYETSTQVTALAKRSPHDILSKVPLTTLDYALEHLGINHVDYISIDVEGWEVQVLHGFAITKYNPKLVIVEDNYQYAELYDYFDKNGYILGRRQHMNAFYVKNKDDASVIATFDPYSLESDTKI